MKKLKFFLLAIMALVLASCKGNEPDGGGIRHIKWET